ncbi:hypothetical protein [Hydrogenophaga atypica]
MAHHHASSSATNSATQRRKAMIRMLATISGDVAVGMVLASACMWMIHIAAWGIFLSFLAWLIAAVLALVISQYVVHPTVKFVLSDRKLDDVTRRVFGLTELFYAQGVRSSQDIWHALKRTAGTVQGRWRPAG